MSRRSTPLGIGLGVLLSLVYPVSAPAVDTASAETPERGAWRFRDGAKPVKVVILAGSIGAYRRAPYARYLAKVCDRAEIKNLSKTGLGAWALKRRFKQQVIRNRHIDWNAPEQEFWLLYGGGLNSVGNPQKTSRYARELFLMARERNMKVVGLTLTPWGDARDRRWRGAASLKYRSATRHVSDFVLGKLEPQLALGVHAKRRTGFAPSAWSKAELPDVAVDLYDSILRDREAPALDPEKLRKAIERDPKFRRQIQARSEAEQEVAIERATRFAADAPKWFMKKEYRGFDHIHPNAEGHRAIAQTTCPSLPASWGCSCERLELPGIADTP